MSRPVRALWIEIDKLADKFTEVWSRPVRALWIEILESNTTSLVRVVEAREGLVD